MEPLRLALGSLFADRFEIDRLAGSGGMGAVYRARDRHSGELVALKLLHKSAAGPEEGQRFTREATLLAELRHPGIVSHIAHGQTPQGQQFLAMEWLEGEDLAQLLSRGPLPVEKCPNLLARIADALAIAHRHGVVHRDLKPSNLFLPGGELDRVKILDFGVARRLTTAQPLTRTSMIVGTPGYMAPEQARGGRDLLPAADMFALGCVLYECLTGEPPFVGDHIAAVLVRILFEEPIPVKQRRTGVPGPLLRLLDRLLCKDPAERLADAEALRAELTAVGDMAGSETAITAAGPLSGPAAFAQSEQSLFSIVLAAPPGATPAPAAALGETLGLAMPDRQALALALNGLRVNADFLADGSLVITVPPLSSVHDQTVVAARAALLTKAHWPAARVALATGRGSKHGGATVGEVVERAARALRGGSAAEKDGRAGVVLDGLSAKLLQGRFVQTPQPDGTLLLAEEKAADESRLLLGKPTPCVGREAELATLDGQLAGCIENAEARAVLVTAPPGAGKSRLRHEFLRRVAQRDQSVTVLQGSGDLIGAGAPYAILGQAIRRLCGLSGSEPLDEQRDRLRERVNQRIPASERERVALFLCELSGAPCADAAVPLLRAARRDPKALSESIRRSFLDWLSAECQLAPVLIVLDDLQWGDALSTWLLDEALHALAGQPLFVLALARPEVHELFPKLWPGHTNQEISLRGLSKKACERLIQQVLGKDVTPDLAARIIEQSAGNALFLEELIRSISRGAAEESVQAPETVLAMLQARICRLAPGPRRAVSAAAIFGEAFWRGGVAALLGLPTTQTAVADWLSNLVDAEVIEPRTYSRLASEQEYRFRHALVREAAYALLTESDLVTGHRLAGEFLHASGETDPVVIAEHYDRGGEPGRALPLYQQAGDDATRLGAYAKAWQCYERATALVSRLPESLMLRRHRVDLLLKQVQIGLRANTPEQNHERLSLAHRLIEAMPAGEPGTDRLLDEDRLRLARTDYLRGQLFYYTGNYDEAILFHERVLPVARELGERELCIIPSFFVGSSLCMQGYMRKSREILAQAIEPLREAGLIFDWMRARMTYAMSLAGSGDYPAACEHVSQTQEHAASSNNSTMLAISHMVCDSLVPWLGHDWKTVVQCSERAICAAQRAGDQVYAYVSYGMRAWARSFMGMPGAAEQDRLMRSQIAQSMGGQLILADWFAAADGEIALSAGRLDQAMESAQTTLSSGGAATLPMSHGIAERVWASALARLGADAAECDRHFASSIKLFAEGGLVLQLALTRLFWSGALRARGDAPAAQEQLERAVAQLQANGCTFALSQASRLAVQPPS